jgi:hypothetical protein
VSVVDVVGQRRGGAPGNAQGVVVGGALGKLALGATRVDGKRQRRHDGEQDQHEQSAA